MKYALISPNELIFDYSNPPVQIGERVAQVEDAPFDVALPLFWAQCPDNIVQDEFYWDGAQFVAKPIPPVMPPAAQTEGTGGPKVVA